MLSLIVNTVADTLEWSAKFLRQTRQGRLSLPISAKEPGRMPFIAPIVAYVDNLGRMLCAACCPDRDTCEPMSGDNRAVNGETCEYCRELLRMVGVRDYVHVANFDLRLIPIFGSNHDV